MFGCKKKRLWNANKKRREQARKELLDHLQTKYKNAWEFGEVMKDGNKFLSAGTEDDSRNVLYHSYNVRTNHIQIVTLNLDRLDDLIDKWLEKGELINISVRVEPRRERKCKAPEQIALMLKSFETRLKNIKLKDSLDDTDVIKILKLEAKIHTLKNVLKL